MHAFLDRLKRRTYDDLDVGDHVEDLSGWIQPGFDDALDIVSDTLGDDVVLAEVGTWKGASAVRIASKFGSRLNALVCVDTWLGAPEFYTEFIDEPGRFSNDVVENGWPQVFHVFTKNVKKRGLDDLVVPFPISSGQAPHVFGYYDIVFDGVYIDAAHEYEAVAADLAAYWKLVRPGGVMWGDDYDGQTGSEHCPGVKKAVDEFVAAHGVRFDVRGLQWMMFK